MIQLSRFAGGAENQSFAIERKQAKRNDRVVVKMIQVRITHNPVEILHTGLRLGENDDVIRRGAFLSALLLGFVRANGQLIQPQIADFLQEFEEDFARCRRVIRRAVVRFQNHIECFAERIELVVDQIVHQIPREHQRIGVLVGKDEVKARRMIAHKTHIKLSIVRNKAAAFAKRMKPCEHFARVWRAL
ncbi:hypothetical protein SDC9_118930 [bioreactor metagenome]|uniref:Uncharacterized protein n=1 Tax=bioreactor metagenome TaxID=1076179 RepID=A0A645C3L4_9ZZZZ